MKTITKTYTLYSFDELSPAAKARALENWAQQYDFNLDAREFLDSLDALTRHFGKLVDYSIDWEWPQRSWFTFKVDEGWTRREVAKTLATLGREGAGDCKLTGFIYDETVLDAFRDAFRHKLPLEECLEAAARAMNQEASKELAYRMGEEYFGEMAEANEWIFLENGMACNHLREEAVPA